MIETVQGKPGKLHAFRIKPGGLFMESIQQVCEEQGIRNGVILSAMGSLDGARFFTPVEVPGKKFPYGYSEPTELQGPVELISTTGFISHGDNDEVLLHIHVALGDSEGKGFAGHLIEGNKCLITIDVILMEIEGISMKRRYDEEIEVFLFAPEKAEEE